MAMAFSLYRWLASFSVVARSLTRVVVRSRDRAAGSINQSEVQNVSFLDASTDEGKFKGSTR
jgi:hypothetical protein